MSATTETSQKVLKGQSGESAEPPLVGSKATLVRMSDLARLAGKKINSSGTAFWQPDDLKVIDRVLGHLLSAQQGSVCIVQGSMPQAIAVGLANAILPKATPAFYDAKTEAGHVEVPQVQPIPKGAGLHFRVGETADFTLVDFSIPNGYIAPHHLPSVAPPVVNRAKGVVLAGHGPYWLIATLGLAYRNYPWVAIRQLNNGAAVAITSSNETALGSIVPEQTVTEASARDVTPRRGEIWLFHGVGGPHPGVIISENVRNAKLNDVMVVPITSKRNGTIHPCAVVLPERTPGLGKDSLAMCHKLVTVKKDQLMGKALGSINDSIAQQLVSSVRRALGD